MSKSSPTRKAKRQNEAKLLAKLGMTRRDIRDSVTASHALNLYLNGSPE